MLFNSYAFIFAFFPVVFLCYYFVGRTNHALALFVLAAASVFFYGWWDVRYVSLLLGSIAFNYAAGFLIGFQANTKATPPKLMLVAAIAINIALLAYFKYANFFVENINELTGSKFSLAVAILPLGISFFTFTQIAFLVDSYQGKVKEFHFLHYVLFVTFFPHLIAGPVLHHAEIMPQFASRSVCRISWDNLAAGLSIFILGLAKKVLLADWAAEFSNPVFDALNACSQPMLFEAWVGSLAFSLQLYFDFSAYCDMAIGLSLMFNVRLPLNFYSPYKATSIIEFWRCWNMTLSRFLRDYLYIPLGGNRSGPAKRYLNLMITMLLGGFWHGASWTFVIWGALHGSYLLLNHGWRRLKLKLGWGDGGRIGTFVAGVLTFLAVVVGWVFFRADGWAPAVAMLRGMAGLNGVTLSRSMQEIVVPLFSSSPWLVFQGFGPFNSVKVLVFFGLGFAIVWLMPNIYQMFQRFRPVYDDVENDDRIDRGNQSVASASETVFSTNLIRWRPTGIWVVIVSIFGVLAITLLGRTSVFLYFQF